MDQSKYTACGCILSTYTTIATEARITYIDWFNPIQLTVWVDLLKCLFTSSGQLFCNRHLLKRCGRRLGNSLLVILLNLKTEANLLHRFSTAMSTENTGGGLGGPDLKQILEMTIHRFNTLYCHFFKDFRHLCWGIKATIAHQGDHPPS